MLIRVFIIICFSSLLSACGFHLMGSNQIPSQLRTLYVDSNKPYSNFTKQVKQTLEQRKIKVVADKSLAPYTLKINDHDISVTQTTTGNSQQTRQYTLTYNVGFNIINNKTNAVITSFNLTSTQTLVMFSGQLLTNTSQEQEAKQQLQRDLIEQLFFHFNAVNTRTALKNQQASRT